MGRRRDDPRDQKAKGFPGKRKGKTEMALARMEKEAERDAKLFADAGQNGELIALPVFLEDRRLGAAQKIWQEAGLERNAAGNWVFNIPDKGYRIRPRAGEPTMWPPLTHAPLYEHQSIRACRRPTPVLQTPSRS